MSAPTEVLLAVHGPVDEEAVRGLVSEHPGLRLAGLIDNDVDWAGRSSVHADALLIACGSPSDHVLSLIRQEAATRPELPVIVLCTGYSEAFFRQVFEAGADDVVLSDGDSETAAQVAFAIQKALSRKRAPHAGVDPGQAAGGNIICVLGPKGGTGKTLTASNLASALALEGKRVALVDLDLQFGDLGLVLGLTPERSIFDLVTAGGGLDAEKLRAFLTPHRSGVQVLLAPTRPDQASAVTTDFLRELYQVMRQEFDFIVVDTPPGFTAEVIASVDASSGVCLIGTLDAPSLKNAKLGAETLDLMGYPAERVRIVLNRADSNVGVSHADAVSVLGRAPDVLVPSTRDVVRSVNNGEPIVLTTPRSEAAKAFVALARVFIARTEAEVSPDRIINRRRGLRALARA